MATLSRQYRPQTFADITDQDSVKETLRLEVEMNRLGHAYLFSGPRGIGKTTAARIFAKALNCLDVKKGEPCNVCEACKEADERRSLCVIEMDAASRTGVDNIREDIIEHVRIPPVGRRMKVYILDEAHMLSANAWNALLKTIEEPPPYAIFIFVTTELHKVPATIISRCQRFEFKRVVDVSMAKRVRSLAEQEGATIVDDVVATIVRKADGCVRDAEQLLGQVLSLGEKDITTDIAALVMPLSRVSLAAKLLETWSRRMLGPSLKAVSALEEDGVPLLPIFDDLIESSRQLLLASDSSEWKERLAIGDEGERTLATLVGSFTPAELSDIALMCMERRRDARQGADVRFCMELAAAAVALGILPHGPSSASSAPSTMKHVGTLANATVPAPSPRPTPSAPSATQSEAVRPASVAPSVPIAAAIAANTPTLAEVTGSVSKGNPSTLRADLGGSPSLGTLSIGDVHAKWPAFLRAMDQKSASLTFVLKITRPLSIEGNVLTVQFQYPFHREKILGDMKSRRVVEDCLREAMGNSSVYLEGVVGTEAVEQKEARNQDMVSSIIKAFGGQVVEGEAG